MNFTKESSVDDLCGMITHTYCSYSPCHRLHSLPFCFCGRNAHKTLKATYLLKYWSKCSVLDKALKRLLRSFLLFMNDALRSVILNEQKLQVALFLFTQVARPSAGSWFLASQMFFVVLYFFIRSF